MGQTITWVAPYQFNQRLPFDIDYKVIGTFQEFYMALLKFVNFKLFKDIGVKYPLDLSAFTGNADEIFLSPEKVQEYQA
jgi:pescadillo protein